jgi:hypothetical protein
MFGADKDFSNLFQHIARAQAEGFDGEASILYVGREIEADTINSGRGGSIEVLQSLNKRLQDLTQDYTRPRSAPVPADTQ